MVMIGRHAKFMKSTLRFQVCQYLFCQPRGRMQQEAGGRKKKTCYGESCMQMLLCFALIVFFFFFLDS